MPPTPASNPPHSADDASARVVDLLRRSGTYPERPPEIELRETHISWVFLTDEHAYKLKKPVRFEFLDFSTPELRRQACQAELRLNRRLAENVYQRVAAITREASGELALEGQGEPVDWVVVMRRLPDADALAARLVAGRVKPADLESIAARLVRFYAELSPVQIEPAVYRREIEQHLRANFAALARAAERLEWAIVRRVSAAQLAFLLTQPEPFDARVTDGRIVEGHGDLRPEHIYLAPEPVVIDCIEFNTEFRRLDVLDELCFLAMECAHRGYAASGTAIAQRVLAELNDQPPPALKAFYTAYRACVRAKVSVLRAEQLTVDEQAAAWDEAARYLELAAAEVHRLGPPHLMVVRGPAGVGKTTLAAELAERLALVHLSTDALRQQIFGKEPAQSAHDQGRYAPVNRRRVYNELFARAGSHLANGVSCVLDGAFLTRDLIEEALQLAERHRATPLVVDCTCPAETAAARIAERAARGMSLSEAQAATHARQCEQIDPVPPAVPQLQVDTSQPLPSLVEPILRALGRATAGDISGP